MDVRGVVGSHNDERMMYVSPVNGRTVDLSTNIAMNLFNSFNEIFEKKS